MRRFLAISAIVIGTILGTMSTGGAAPAQRVDAPRPASRLRMPLAVPAAEATVVLYGDSLAWESREHVAQILTLAGVSDVRAWTMGGTAICDWLDQMRTDAATLRPTAVIVEFSGNALTPCMLDASGQSLAYVPDAYHGRYAEDAREVLRIFAASGTRVYFAGSPTTRTAEEGQAEGPGWLNDLYASLTTDASGAHYVDAGAAVLRRGHWTESLPCLAGEPCTGGSDASGRQVNVVRAPDGGHFCPGAPDASAGVTGDCPVWSSGAYRFARAMAMPVVRDLEASALATLPV